MLVLRIEIGPFCPANVVATHDVAQGFDVGQVRRIRNVDYPAAAELNVDGIARWQISRIGRLPLYPEIRQFVVGHAFVTQRFIKLLHQFGRERPRGEDNLEQVAVEQHRAESRQHPVRVVPPRLDAGPHVEVV